MPIDPDLLRLFGDMVQVEALVSTDAYGKPTYGPVTAYRARIENRIRLIRTTDNQERVSTGCIYLAGDAVVQPHDRLTLSDNTHPVMLRVDVQPDEHGPYYVAIYT